MQKSINELSITELKAMAYDSMIIINENQRKLNAITMEIRNRDSKGIQIIKDKAVINKLDKTKK